MPNLVMTEMGDAFCASGTVPSPIAKAQGTDGLELPRPKVGRLGPSHNHGGEVPSCLICILLHKTPVATYDDASSKYRKPKDGTLDVWVTPAVSLLPMTRAIPGSFSRKSRGRRTESRENDAITLTGYCGQWSAPPEQYGCLRH